MLLEMRPVSNLHTTDMIKTRHRSLSQHFPGNSNFPYKTPGSHLQNLLGKMKHHV